MVYCMPRQSHEVDVAAIPTVSAKDHAARDHAKLAVRASGRPTLSPASTCLVMGCFLRCHRQQMKDISARVGDSMNYPPASRVVPSKACIDAEAEAEADTIAVAVEVMDLS